MLVTCYGSIESCFMYFRALFPPLYVCQINVIFLVCSLSMLIPICLYCNFADNIVRYLYAVSLIALIVCTFCSVQIIGI